MGELVNLLEQGIDIFSCLAKPTVNEQAGFHHVQVSGEDACHLLGGFRFPCSGCALEQETIHPESIAHSIDNASQVIGDYTRGIGNGIGETVGLRTERIGVGNQRVHVLTEYHVTGSLKITGDFARLLDESGLIVVHVVFDEIHHIVFLHRDIPSFALRYADFTA